eukprot:8349111-Ditylum_brightwellii.AAC.1
MQKRHTAHPCVITKKDEEGKLKAPPSVSLLLDKIGEVGSTATSQGCIHTLGAWTHFHGMFCTDGRGEGWRLCHTLSSIINFSTSMPFMKKEMEKRSAR